MAGKTWNEIHAMGLPWRAAYAHDVGSWGVVAYDFRPESSQIIIIIPRGLPADIAIHIADVHNAARPVPEEG